MADIPVTVEWHIEGNNWSIQPENVTIYLGTHTITFTKHKPTSVWKFESWHVYTDEAKENELHTNGPDDVFDYEISADGHTLTVTDHDTATVTTDYWYKITLKYGNTVYKSDPMIINKSTTGGGG